MTLAEISPITKASAKDEGIAAGANFPVKNHKCLIFKVKDL